MERPHLLLAIYKNLKSVMIHFKPEFSIAISIMEDKHGDMSFFKIPKCTNPCISLSVIGLSSSLTWNDLMEKGDLSMTYKSTSILGHIPISSLRLNVSLYLTNSLQTSSCSSFDKQDWLRSIVFSIVCLSVIFLLHLDLTRDMDLWTLPFLPAAYFKNYCIFQIYCARTQKRVFTESLLQDYLLNFVIS